MAQRPTELVLTARVARMYYLDDRSKTEIADELAISRFRVARLLDSARRSGLVRIEIDAPGKVNTDLSAQLQTAFGLAHAIVVDISDEDPVVLRRHLGEAAADVLHEIVKADDVLGLAWARSLSGIGAALDGFVPCPVVQLTGALSRPDGSDVLELVRRVARAGGGPAHVFYAPLVAADATTARTLRRQPDVARAAAMLPSVTVGVVGIGAWQAGLSTIFDAVEHEAQQRTRRLGVTAEVSGACSPETTCVSGPGYTSASWSLSAHRTSYGGSPSGDRTERIRPRRARWLMSRPSTTSQSPFRACIATSSPVVWGAMPVQGARPSGRPQLRRSVPSGPAVRSRRGRRGSSRRPGGRPAGSSR